MNWKFGLAAIVLGGTAMLHTFGGEIAVHAPLLDAAPSQEMALYITLLWHFVTAFLIWGTITVVMALRRPERWTGAALNTGLLCGVMGLMFLTLGAVNLGSIWIAPQWVLLLPIAALLLWPNPRKTLDD